MNKDDLWNKFIDNISNKISSVSVNTWFKDTKIYDIDEDDIILLTNHEAIKKHLRTSYYDTIEEIFLELTGKNYNIKILTNDDIKEKTEKKSKEEITKKDKQNLKLNTLNKKYNFENFIVGETNRIAYLAALAVAEKPGNLYNPLFIYGNSGLGKTHLMNAIGNFAEENLGKNVLYVTAETFVNDFISLTKKHDEKNIDYIELFKKKYRDVDILMIDDIQFLSGATKSQQEFTNTFNSLYHNEKQIIICSDKSVNDLKLLEDRLKTRFNWGLTVNIYPPDLELKKEIIKKKMKSEEIALNLTDDVIAFIASSCGSDVRNLEGALTRLFAYSAIMGVQKIDLNFAMEALKDYTDHMLYSTNTVEKIQMQVAEYFKVSVEDLKGKKRNKNIAHARAIAMYLSRMLTEETCQQIGLKFGGKDHSTVIHAYEKISNEIKYNKQLDDLIVDIKNSII